MIERLQVRGYKSLVDVDVKLDPLTVLVGANGSGKTSVLEAIEWLPDSVEWVPANPNGKKEIDEPYGFEFERVLSRQVSDEAIQINAHVVLSGKRSVLSGHFTKRAFRVECDEKVISTLGVDRLSGEPVQAGASISAELEGLVRGIRTYRLDADAMAEPAYSNETSPLLEFDGENLAVVLDALQGEARERFDEIERRLTAFVPSLKSLRVKRARTRIKVKVDEEPPALGRRIRRKSLGVVGHQVSFDFEHARNIRADDASEGTVLLLGLLTVIEASEPDQPLTIMLDDLDRALHPKAQEELVGYLHELVRSRPNLQIIATTHSPYLVEHLEFEEVRAITQAPDGTSVIGSLTDHPRPSAGARR